MKTLRYEYLMREEEEEEELFNVYVPYLTLFYLLAVPTYTILQRQGGGITDSTYRPYGSCAGNFSGMDTLPT